MDGPTATGPNGPAPAPSGGDWRARLDLGDRRRTVNSIKKTLKKLVPLSVPVPVPESKLQKIAQQYEEKIYTAAINESDYLRKITLQMHSMESQMKEEQKKPPGNAQVIQNQKPPSPAPGFPPRGDSSADRLCQGAPIPPQIHCSPLAAEALVDHTFPVPVNATPPMVSAPVLLPSPPPAPSSLANPAGSVSSGGDENLCLGELMLDIPDDLFNDLGFAVSNELFNPDDFFNDLDFPDAAAVMAGPTLPEQEATPVSTPPFVMVPTPPPAAPAPALPHL